MEPGRVMSGVLIASCRLYNFLLGLYPPSLRTRFGEEMAGVFEQQIQSEWQERGFAGLARVWWCVGREILQSALPSRLMRAALSIPVAALLSSCALFLFFFWITGIAQRCVK